MLMPRKEYGCREGGEIGAKKAITTFLFRVCTGDDEECARTHLDMGKLFTEWNSCLFQVSLLGLRSHTMTP